MTDTVSAATAAMLTDLERLRAVGQNLANTATPGYRAEFAVNPGAQQPFVELLGGADPAALVQLTLDTRAGALRQTDRPLDLAIEGAGFFRVETAQGVRYTRRGDFMLAPDGTLKSAEGYPVLAAEGEIRLTSDQVKVSQDGSLHQDERSLGRLALAVFDSSASLVHEGGGLYRTEATPRLGDEAGAIRQGYLEAANVQPVAEMVRLMETVRHFGLTAQALRAHDEILESSISRLGEF